MGLLLVMSESEGKFSPIEVGSCPNIQDTVSWRYDLVSLLNFMQTDSICIFILFIALDEVWITYFWAIIVASSS